jgi:hypothetical protein
MKRAGLVCFLGAGLLCAASCGGNDEVTIVLLDPCDDQDGVSFREQSQYTEILLVRGGCPSDEKLVAGDVENVAVRRLAKSSGAVPSIGDVPKEKFGFTVLLKDPSCGVVGFGCTEADMSNIREVRIAVRAWADATGPRACPGCESSPCCQGGSCPPVARPCCQPLTGGSCPIPLQCSDGRCAQEAVDGGATGCDLTVLNGGALPGLLAAGNQLTGPGIVGTGTGFVIGYREASSDGKLQTTLIPLTASGALGTAARTEVVGCAGKMPTDGVGMAFASGFGLIGVSLPDCGDAKGAGASFTPFDASGSPEVFTSPRNPGFSDLTLARHGAIAAASQPNDWEFLYRAVGSGGSGVERALVRGNALLTNPAPAELFPGASFGTVVTSAQARAFVAGVPGEAGTITTIQLSVPSQGEPPTIIGELSLPGAEWAAATAWNNRVAAAVPATSGMSWMAAQISSGTVSTLVDGSVLGVGAIAGADIVAHLDNLLFALGQPGKITVNRLRGAQGVLSQTPSDPQTLSGSQMAAFDGKQIAVAASGQRVAVVWLSKQQPSGSEPTGGYAVLQCADE